MINTYEDIIKWTNGRSTMAYGSMYKKIPNILKQTMLSEFNCDNIQSATYCLLNNCINPICECGTKLKGSGDYSTPIHRQTRSKNPAKF